MSDDTLVFIVFYSFLALLMLILAFGSWFTDHGDKAMELITGRFKVKKSLDTLKATVAKLTNDLQLLRDQQEHMWEELDLLQDEVYDLNPANEEDTTSRILEDYEESSPTVANTTMLLAEVITHVVKGEGKSVVIFPGTSSSGIGFRVMEDE